MDSTLVIKVKYGDTLRRFNAHVSKDGQLDLDMKGLREKILDLFDFPSNADLALTYVDEDGDLVTLVNNDDLLDVSKQSLKFLKVSVQVNNGSSMPMRISNPAREKLSKVSHDLASIARSSSCIVSELVDCFSKLGQLMSDPNQPSQDGNNKNETSRQSSVTSKKSVGVGLSSDSNSYKCPNGDTPVGNGLSATSTTRLPFDDFSIGMFHRGFRCDGCGVNPIFGSRYKSKVIDDYDLCGICFAQIGNETDYTIISRPVSYREPLEHFLKIKPVRPELDSCFIMDFNVLDGIVMNPSTDFTKIWRMRNCGSISWPQGTRLVWIGGEKFSREDSFNLEIPANGAPVDGEVDVGVDFTSPELPGCYVSFWRMQSPSGEQFGQRISVKIQVDGAKKESNPDGGLDLNLPADENTKCPQIIDLNEQALTAGDAKEKYLVEELEQNGLNEEEIDFCSLSEWDPILDELQEMGFGDGNKNKELLERNNGSISRVVMDLLTGEKA